MEIYIKMKRMIRKKRGIIKTVLWFVPATLAAGVINGLLGAGGGVVMLYVIRAILGHSEDAESASRDAFATVVAVILPVSVVSAVTYGARGNLDMDVMQVFAVPALVGGIVGAYLTDRLPTRLIKGVFAVLVIVSGVRMIW